MLTPPLDYSPDYSHYYYPPQMRYQSQIPAQHADQLVPTPMQQGQSAVDPALALYHPSYYPPFNPHQASMAINQQNHQFMPPPMPMMPHSSPSSPTSDSVDTPPADLSASSYTRKRASSTGASSSRKKAREDDGDAEDEGSPNVEKEEGKAKATRGSRACTVCRRLKMKCVGAEQGPPCKRCQAGHHECIFEESNRGKRSSTNVKKHEQLTRSLRKMERTLDTVLRSISNPGLTSVMSGMVSRSPSPSSSNSRPNTNAVINNSSPIPQPPPQDSSSGGELRLHSLPDNALNPLGLLAEASLANQRTKSENHHNRKDKTSSPDSPKPLAFGVANDIYFKPGPMTILPLRRLFIERQIQPEMLNFTSADEVKDLFKIYFTHQNMHACLLEENFHTPSLVCSRSPLLLTTICAIAAKFYTARPELHARLTNMARKLAFSSAEQGYKSVEIVQAYILLTLWGCGPVERYERDRTWLLLGLAIRMAIDLNLHRKTSITHVDTDESRSREKEVRNRERTWLLVFSLDRAYSQQMGKPTSVKEDSIIRSASEWWRSQDANPFDVKLCGYVELQRIVARSLELLYSDTNSASGLHTTIDYYVTIKAIEAQLYNFRDLWYQYHDQAGGDDAIASFRRSSSLMYFNYALLTINSFGLQDALERTPMNIAHFFSRCYSAASDCANILIERMGPANQLQYAPDTHFVVGSYAALSLLKLIRPDFHSFLPDEQDTINIIKRLADLYERVAVNQQHTPALYSVFLKAVLSSRLEARSAAASEVSTDVGHADNDTTTVSDATRATSQYSTTPEITVVPPNPPAPPEYQFNEMGPVADISTFPPTMAPDINFQEHPELLSIDNILSSNFWDSVLVPGYSNTMEGGLSSGFLYGAGGSGIITPRMDTPHHPGPGVPMMGQRDDLNGMSNMMYQNAPGIEAGTNI